MNELENIDLQIVRWAGDDYPRPLQDLLDRPAFDPEADTVARSILEDIRKRGDEAVIDSIRRFDHVELKPEQLRVANTEIVAAREEVDPEFMASAREAHRRITTFAKAGMKKNWSISSRKGGTLGEQFIPFDRVGFYIPGGTAPLVSTALMTVTLAKVAGVIETVACTPASPDGKVNPYLLFALDLAGATEIYRIGGIQAVGAMAYGTSSIKRVQKIAGPGGQYVTAAKRLVYGDVALDLVAGPSEIAIMADDTARPCNVAADLLSQAEHGTGHEKALLVTNSARLAEAVKREIKTQALLLSRKDAIASVLKQGTLLVVVNHLDTAMELCNRFAPEHLEIMVDGPRSWLKKVRNAGAVFAGEWTPECVGDFVAGPSHVLPTGGTAAMFSGLTVDDFRKKTSIISYTRSDLQETLKIISDFSRVEGLDAHGRSAQVRFEK